MIPGDAGTEAAPSHAPLMGRRRYDLVRRIGSGGMAEVYMGRMLASEGVARTVAVKLIREPFANHAPFRASLAQEARFAASLVHTNIVNVIDFDQDEHGRLFLVMEYVDGVDLWRLCAGRALPLPVAIHVATEVLRALGYAHGQPLGEGRGIVHRDVSPQNVLLGWRGDVKLTDFGIAKAITTSGILSGIKGKASYMSPEQAAQRPIDARSDLFSLGVVLWELVTGRRMFEGLHTMDVLNQIILGPIPSPSSVRPIRADLEAVILRLLAKDRAHRYPTAREAISALLACQDAPQNGPSELAAYLAERFPKGSPHARQESKETADPSMVATVTAIGAETGLGRAIELETDPDPLDTIDHDEAGASHDRPDSPGRRPGPLTRWLTSLGRRKP